MRRILQSGHGSLILLAALFACANAGEPSAQVPEKPKAEPTLTVATYNINWGNVDLPQTAAVIRKALADLVLLQETTVQSEAYLRRTLGSEYRHVLFQGDRGQYAAERFGILSKLPVAESRFLKPQHGLFGAWIGTVRWEGRKLQFVNVHLQPALMSRGISFTAAMQAFRQMEETHAGEIEHVVKNLSLELPTLIAGDFNSMSSFAAPTFLVRKGLVDSFASVTGQPDTHVTWRWPTRFLELSGRIDYIFHTGQLRTVRSEIIPSTASDHHLLVSRLQWQIEAGRPGAGTQGNAPAGSR